MSVANDIRNQIKRSIQTCASVQTVYGHEEVNPSGWPAVMLTSTDMNGEFSSNTENSRVYSFRVLCLFPIGKDMPGLAAGTNRMEYAETTLLTVVDEIINAVDDNFVLEGSPVLYVNAADAKWSYVTYEGGEARAVEVTLNVYTEITI